MHEPWEALEPTVLGIDIEANDATPQLHADVSLVGEDADVWDFRIWLVRDDRPFAVWLE